MSGVKTQTVSMLIEVTTSHGTAEREPQSRPREITIFDQIFRGAHSAPYVAPDSARRLRALVFSHLRSHISRGPQR